MIIGVDGSYAILKNNTTEGNYSKIVVDAIAECYARHKIYVYTPYVENRATATSLAAQPNVEVKQPRKTLSRTLWYNNKGIADEMNRHHVNVYHGLCGRLPLGIRSARARAVVTIHGLAFMRYPGDYGWFARQERNFLTSSACRLADGIVVTSQHTRDDLIELMGIDPAKIQLIYPAVDRRFTSRAIPAELEAVSSKYKLPKHYILVVSSLIEHKNVLAVLQAMKQMQDRDMHLVIVGKATRYYNSVLRKYAQANQLMHRLMHITRAHAIDMPSIYHMADVLVAPSRYEGFGLTVIEGQACGVPIITTSGTAQQEAAGEAALYFDPDDVATLTGHLDRLLTDTDLRQQLVDAGKRNIERFTHQRLADDLDALYHQVLR